MKLNRNKPRAVTYGPLKYGGMALPDMHTRQTQHHTKYAIQQLRWDKTVAKDLLVTLANLQLESGFVTPILESKAPHLDYIEQGWIAGLQNRLQQIDASLWVESAWTPKLQRIHDVVLMEQFLKVDTYRHERKDLSACCKWLRVVTVADLANESGTMIPAG